MSTVIVHMEEIFEELINIDRTLERQVAATIFAALCQARPDMPVAALIETTVDVCQSLRDHEGLP